MNSRPELERLYLELKRRELKTDLPRLMEEVLGYQNLAPFHREIWNQLMTVEMGQKRGLFLLPRGHLKSTMLTIAYPILRIIQNPDVRILITNALLDNSKAFLREIKGHFERNDNLKNIFGRFQNQEEKWSESQIIVKQRKLFKKEPTIQITSIDKSVVSQHYDLIIVDDLINREGISTKEQREKARKYLKDLYDLLEPGGMILVIGTRWHDDDLYGSIIRQGSFEVMVRKVIEDGKPIFPQKFSMEYIEQLKRDKGSSEFNGQYMNDPISDEDAEFRREDLIFYNPKEVTGDIYITVDPAVSKNDNADYTGIVVNEVINGVWNIRQAYHARLSGPELIDEIFFLHRKYKNKLRALGVEDIMYVQALDYEFTRRMQETKEWFTITKLKHRGRNKENRIRALLPLVERGNIKVAEGCDDLVDELVRFPIAENDDILDALAYQLDIVNPTEHNSSTKETLRDDDIVIVPIYASY